VGTGDGRVPFVLAARCPERLFIGLDANAAALRERSVRAFRSRTPNLLYVRAAVEALPAELSGVADRVTVVLPWGSLLAAVARPVPGVLAGLCGLCRPGATLTVVFGVDAARDGGEAARLDLPPIDQAYLQGPLAAAYAAAGFTVRSVRPLSPDGLARWPSTWAQRLAHGRERSVFEVEALTTPATARRT
jgi:16S rRNA (adenine(1408)-N(1))-methyltransferase